MPTLTFAPFQAHIDAEFWQTLSQRKIDLDQLNDDNKPLFALYRSRSSSEHAQPLSRLDLSRSSFDASSSIESGSCIARGIVHNTNTLEEFQHMDKNNFIHKTASSLWEDMLSGAALEEPSLLASFALLCFAELKKYTYIYWMSYPTFTTTWSYSTRQIVDHVGQTKIASAIQQWLACSDPSQHGFFAYDSDDKTVHDLSAWRAIQAESRVFGFVDPSGTDNALGWPARNLLCMLALRTGLKKINLLSYTASGNFVLYTNCELCDFKQSMPKPIGWERNNLGKLQPRYANLASVMNPINLANDAVELNLKLMKWRIVPELDLDGIKKARCLLLGAGTLGCNVGRLLLGWGVKDITFIDSGRVSFSNPVRQPLFNFVDCLDQGKDKAKAAADALRDVYPGVNARGVKLSVPMIGHPYNDSDSGETDFNQLEAEIDAHDAIFLLMDSRESRWLPTVIGTAKAKLVINAALGFDNFVVMRHGIPNADTQKVLGCYFCNDVVVPADSTSDRTLDQQCTVTRPGLAALASATAVELFASVSQHPEKARCPAPSETSRHEETVLGSVPHIVRGYLRSWQNKILSGEAYPFCSACSTTIVQGYATGGWSFVRRAINETGWIDHLSGLKEIQAGIEGIDVDWDSESDAGA